MRNKFEINLSSTKETIFVRKYHEIILIIYRFLHQLELDKFVFSVI